MTELQNQLGVDWRLLLSQAVNFLILLAALRFFLYKPISRILKERQKKITEGLLKAEEADRRLKEIDEIRKEKIKKAENAALDIVRAAEKKSKEIEIQLLEEAKKKEAEELMKLEALLRAKKEEASLLIKKEAAEFVKKTLIKTVELAPQQIDEALIRKAAEETAANKL
jgi:F-type H+-transporting ATPase subunit b